MDWISRNLILLIGGIILLPISLFTLLIGLALGVGFAPDPALEALKLIVLLGSYSIVYFFSVCMSFRNFKRNKSYGYWDMLPIYYFTVVFILMLSLR